MGFFGNLFSKEAEKQKESIPKEVFDSIRVMQDDLDEIHGKPKVSRTQESSESSESSNHPFLGSNQGTSENARAGVPLKPEEGRKESGLKTAKKEADSSPSEEKKSVIIPVVSIILLVAIIAGAGFIFYQNTRLNEDSAVVSEIPAQVPETQEELEEGLPSEEPIFSIDKPNLVQIDPETDGSTPENMFVKLDALREGVRTMNPSVPVEFLVRDLNNNPIAFSRVAYLLGLNVPESVLSSFEESFSLSFVPEKDSLYMALVIDVKDEAALMAEMKKGEASAPAWFFQILYRSFLSVAPAKSVFSDGSYGTVATRYSILDSEKGLSFDYTIVNGKLVIGTSKDSFRSVLGKVLENGLK